MSSCPSDKPYLGDAAWIWETGSGPRPNTYVAFRLGMDSLPGEPAQDARIRVSAGSLYLLYVNGAYLGRGPVRAWKGHAGIDEYGIGSRLRPGRNTISVLVHYYGVDVGGCQHTGAGFLLEGTINGVSLSTGTAAWQANSLACWHTDSPRTSLYAGFNEDVDMERYDPRTWQQGHDDGNWRDAGPVDGADRLWPQREPRMIPLLAETDLDPMQPIALGEYDPPATGTDAWCERMGAERHRHIAADRVSRGRDAGSIQIAAGEPAYVILDNGRMTSGVVDIDVETEDGGELRIGYADRCFRGDRPFREGRDQRAADLIDNTDVRLLPDHGGPGNHVDRLTLRKGANRWRGAFNLRGFRYVKLSFPCLTGAVKLNAVRAREITYAAENRGDFRCSDDVLNRIWTDGRLTTRLCMSDTFMDNPSRERQQYGGDGYLQALYAYYYFDDTQLWRQFLHQFSQGMRDDRAMQSGGPWCWDQVIPAWTLLWIESIREYVNRTGETALLNAYADRIVDALAWFEECGRKDGLLDIEERWGWGGAPGGVVWNFIDWQDEDDQLRGEEARLTLNCIYISALRTAAWIMKRAGRTSREKAYLQAARELSLRISELLADPESVASRSEHVLAYATLAGPAEDRMANVAESVRRGAARSDIMYVFFTLRALEQEGYEDEALALVRDIFGEMLQDGVSTFYETRHAQENPSRAFCQGIGGLPGFFLPRLAAGIREIRNDDRAVLLRPLPRELDWARAVVPTRDGDVVVSTTKGGPGCEMEIELPPGWHAVAGPESVSSQRNARLPTLPVYKRKHRKLTPVHWGAQTGGTASPQHLLLKRLPVIQKRI